MFVNLKKFLRDPLGFLKRAYLKLIIGPRKYGSKEDGYEAASYWNDRFSKYGYSLQGAGDESVSVEENKKMYHEAASVFRSMLQDEQIDFPNINVLEIGVGAAFYTGQLQELGVTHYTGIDIADVLFEQHQQKFPQYRFIRQDVTKSPIEGQYDLIIMIDVSQHIVKEDKIKAAFDHIKHGLAPRGCFLIMPLADQSKKHHYYVHVWAPEFVKRHFSEYAIREGALFRGGRSLIIKKR